MRQTPDVFRRWSVWRAAAAVATLVVAGLVPQGALAQAGAWPNRPVKMIVPFPAGSITDSLARVMSDGLSKALGQPVVVENKAGANGMIGASEVARSAADGYTLLVTNSSSITINPLIYKKVPYKAGDFTPITTILEAPFILVVNGDWAQKNKIVTLKDIIDYARNNPGQLTYGSAGPGNIAHLSYAMLSNRAKVQTTHVPYKSSAQAQMAVLSGELNSAFDTWTALPHIKAGKLKAIAVSSTRRMEQLPDVPTVQEAGMADFNVSFWIGMLAPARTPSDIVQKLSAVSQTVLDDPKARAFLSTQGEVVLLDPTAFSRRVAREVAEWGQVIQREAIALD